MKNKFSNKIVIAVVTLNVLFSIAVLAVFAKVGSEPTALIGCWFAFTTGELWMLTSIKKTKVKKESGVVEQGNISTPSGSTDEVSGVNQEMQG